MTLNNSGRSKKTDGGTGPKSKGGSLAVGRPTFVKIGSAPPPTHTPRDHNIIMM